jgi:rod shape-determining protein MreD
LLSTNIWFVFPDVFLLHVFFLASTYKIYPKVYFFILNGFFIDIFFFEIIGPYTITYLIIGIFLTFSLVRWEQRSLLIQFVLIASISLLLNSFIAALEGVSFVQNRVVPSTILLGIIWVLIFLYQKDKWLKNI